MQIGQTVRLKFDAFPYAKFGTYEARIDALSDTTVEALAPILRVNPRGLLLARDELAGWIGSFDRYSGKGKSGADAANWLSMLSTELASSTPQMTSAGRPMASRRRRGRCR